MILVSVFVVFTISLCSANTFVCHHYIETTKSLEIYCDHYRNRLPKNCTNDDLVLNPSDVLNLKIEGCDQSTIGNASELYPNIQTLDISYSGYYTLNWTGNVFENAVLLNASNNQLTAIPTAILSKFPKIEQLSLINNKLERISNDDFENVGQELKNIFLTHNRLKSIDDNAFDHLKKFSGIELSHNEFSTFPMALSSNSSVQDVIMLENPQLTTINCTFIQAIGSKHVYFTWKYITEFDGSCSKWKFFINETGWNAMDGIYPNFAGHSNIFCNNSDFENCFENIKYFVAGPGAFKNAEDMVKVLGPSALKIDVSGTGLQYFSQSQLQNLNQLTYFSAAENRIENIDEVVKHLPSSIEYLNLSGNPLRRVPVFYNYERFTALTHLNLSGTQLPIFNVDSFQSLRQLLSFDISDNDLRNVDFSTLQSLNHLKEFRAANGRIQNISEIVQHLGPFVEKLDLSGNYDFNLRSFDRLRSLKELNLSNINTDNDLQEIDIGQLPGTLERLDLHGNNLKQINNLDRKHFPALKALDISKNELDCDHLNDLRSEFKDADVIGDKCDKYWIILFTIIAILGILFFIILCNLCIMPRLTKD